MIYCNYIKIEQGLFDKTFFTKFVHIRHFLFLFIVFCNSLITYSFVYAYGVYTIIFGFGITYLLVVYLILFYKVFNITHSEFPAEIRPKFKNSTLEDSLIENSQ